MSRRFDLGLIATDLDGTLLRPDHTVSDRTRAAFRAAHARGVPTAMVTARPPRAIRELAEHLGLDGLAVCSNGAILYDIGRDEILEQVALETETARRLMDAVAAHEPAALLAGEYGRHVRAEPAFPRTPAFQDLQDHHVVPPSAMLDEALVKLMVHHPEDPVEALVVRLSQRLGGEVAVTHSGDLFAEIAAPNVSKATGVAMLCRRLGLDPTQVAAFGDMPNDIPMMAAAGLAVAVANAHPDVLAIAHEVTASNVDDGVAQAIERLLA